MYFSQYEEISKVALQKRMVIATVIAIAKYTENKVQFTVSFNESMELIGIYIKVKPALSMAFLYGKRFYINNIG